MNLEQSSTSTKSLSSSRRVCVKKYINPPNAYFKK